MKARVPQSSRSSQYVEAFIEGQGLAPSGDVALFRVDCQGISGKETPQAFVVSVPAGNAEWVKLTRVRLGEDRQAPARLVLVNDTEVPCTVVRALGDSRRNFLRSA
jgi:hypothetical protein